MASGAFSTIQVVGSAFSVTIVGVILFNVLDQFGGEVGAGRPAANAYGEAFSIATIYNLIAIVLALAIFARLQPSQGASSSLR
jgi:hypothetical protein